MENLEKEKLTYHKGQKEGMEIPPNSFESVLKNYEGQIEADIVLIADGNLIMIHPQDFGMNLPEVEKLTLKEIEQLRVPVVNPEAHGLMIPLLKEFLGSASDADTRLTLELKASSSQKAVGLSDKVLTDVLSIEKEGGFGQNRGFLESKIGFESTSVNALKTIQDISLKENRKFYLGLGWPSDKEWAKKTLNFNWQAIDEIDNKKKLSWEELGIEIASKNGFDEIVIDWRVVTSELVMKAHEKKLKINAGLVKDETTARMLIALGVDRIFGSV